MHGIHRNKCCRVYFCGKHWTFYDHVSSYSTLSLLSTHSFFGNYFLYHGNFIHVCISQTMLHGLKRHFIIRSVGNIFFLLKLTHEGRIPHLTGTLNEESANFMLPDRKLSSDPEIFLHLWWILQPRNIWPWRYYLNGSSYSRMNPLKFVEDSL